MTHYNKDLIGSLERESKETNLGDLTLAQEHRFAQQ